MGKVPRVSARKRNRTTAGAGLRAFAASGALALVASMGLPPLAAQAVQAPVGSGFTVTPADLS